MRCSNCYKRIIEGEEVQQGSSGFFRTSWDWGGGSEIVCVRCAKILRRRRRRYSIIFFTIWGSMMIMGILTLLIKKFT